MKIRGEIFSGALRGTPLVEKYFPRLVGILGFKPFIGTMDIKLERDIEMKAFSTKTIDHVLQDGKKVVNAYLAKVRIRKVNEPYALSGIKEKQRNIFERLMRLEKQAETEMNVGPERVEEPTYECWAAQFKNGIYGNDTIELISKDMIKQELNIADGDIIEIEFVENR